MFRRKRTAADFSAEIRAHIDIEAARLRAEGVSEKDAYAAAKRAFGNVLCAEERFYESSCLLLWDEFRNDSVYAFRTLRRNPAFAAATVLTLALGIGANTAIFSAVDAALLRPLPYPHADRIVALYARTPVDSSLSPATFLDFRRQASSFEVLAAFRETPFNITGLDRPERVSGATVTPDFFAVFGVQAQLGRTLAPDRDPPGSARSIVLGYTFWQRHYGANPAVLGQKILIDGELLTVVGIMPPSFQFPPQVELWRPARHRVPEQPLIPNVDQSNSRDTHYFSTIGRLKRGVPLAKAQAEAEAIAGRLRQQYGPEEEMIRCKVVPLREDLVGESRTALLLLLGAVSLLLLIACANVANLVLARGASRQKEVAVRGALGAGSARLLRQFFTESLALALGGGATGVLVAYAAAPWVRAVLPAGIESPFHVNARVLVFSAALSILSAILFGAVPALQAAVSDLNSVLKEGGRTSTAALRGGRARRVLAVSEIALAAVLLVSAGLLLRSFDRLLSVPQGFQAARVMTLQLSLPDTRYAQPETRARFVRPVLERLNAVPGITSAAAISRLPLNPGNSTRSIDIKGRVTPPGGFPALDYLVVTPGYFRTMGIRLLRGRAFTDRDNSTSAPVVIISRSTAQRFWPNENALGQMVTVGLCGQGNQWCEVVGVVDDVRQHSLGRDAGPAVYVPYARDPWPFMAFVVQTTVEPASVAAAMEAAVHAVDKNQPVFNVRTMQDVVSQSVSPRRLRLLLIGAFAVLALALACIGIYGVMAYAVAQRAQEIGVRIALGAGPSSVLRMVVADALRLSLAGAASGLVLSVAAGRLLATMLYRIRPTDAPTLIGVSTALMATALLASAIPAFRATRVDPLVCLRGQ